VVAADIVAADTAAEAASEVPVVGAVEHFPL
jgi:hypothetical protein